MGKPLQVLIVEDSEVDAQLMILELQRGGYDPVYKRVETLFVVVVVGFWTWGALIAASDGRRGSLIAALVFSAISALIALFDLIRYSPIPYGWPLLQIAVWIMLVTNVVAITSVALHLRQ